MQHGMQTMRREPVDDWQGKESLLPHPAVVSAIFPTQPPYSVVYISSGLYGFLRTILMLFDTICDL